MKKRTKIIIIAAICAAIIAGIGVYKLGEVVAYQNKVTNTVISDVDLTRIPDGVYVGEYDVSYIYAKVEVRVSNHAITDIDIIEHRHERGASAESVLGAILERQSLNVDAVSGATNSSVVLKKAVENALVGASIS